jgi:hypothetical protein
MVRAPSQTMPTLNFSPSCRALARESLPPLGEHFVGRRVEIQRTVALLARNRCDHRPLSPSAHACFSARCVCVAACVRARAPYAVIPLCSRAVRSRTAQPRPPHPVAARVCRCVCVHGPVGIGKTAVALQAAHFMNDRRNVSAILWMDFTGVE